MASPKPFSGSRYRKYKKMFLGFPGARESFPFGPEVAVYKNTRGKLFALLSTEAGDWYVNLKCDPHWALSLRKSHPGLIEPGYHMNKKHWNTVKLTGGLPPALVRKMVELSYLLVAPVTRR